MATTTTTATIWMRSKTCDRGRPREQERWRDRNGERIADSGAGNVCGHSRGVHMSVDKSDHYWKPIFPRGEIEKLVKADYSVRFLQKFVHDPSLRWRAMTGDRRRRMRLSQELIDQWGKICHSERISWSVEKSCWSCLVFPNAAPTHHSASCQFCLKLYLVCIFLRLWSMSNDGFRPSRRLSLSGIF